MAPRRYHLHARHREEILLLVLRLSASEMLARHGTAAPVELTQIFSPAPFCCAWCGGKFR